MLASKFHEVFGDNADFWGQAPDYPLEDWQYEVANDDTRLGYWDWVLCQKEQADEERARNSGQLVYELCLPGYPDDAGEGKDGVIWVVLDDTQHEAISRLAKKLRAHFCPTELDVDDSGIDYDGSDLSQMNQLVARLVKEIDEKKD